MKSLGSEAVLKVFKFETPPISSVGMDTHTWALDKSKMYPLTTKNYVGKNCVHARENKSSRWIINRVEIISAYGTVFLTKRRL